MQIKIAGAQLGSIWEDPILSLKKAEPYICKAADQGALLICFPEQYATGWDPRSLLHIQNRDDLVVSLFSDLAQEYGIAILGSFRERFVPKPRNTCIVFNREGEEIASYSKCHLFTPGAEEEQFYPGDTLGIFSLAGVSFGIAICYDLRFSGLFDVYAEAGVSCMMVPAAWPASRIDHWELSIRAQALEHQFYVIGVNTTGLNTVDRYCGRSLAADPSGTVIARAGQGEDLMVAAIDPDAMVHLREALPVKLDRRPELYKRLRDREGES